MSSGELFTSLANVSLIIVELMSRSSEGRNVRKVAGTFENFFPFISVVAPIFGSTSEIFLDAIEIESKIEAWRVN
jgi:hypothetical protein